MYRVSYVHHTVLVCVCHVRIGQREKDIVSCKDIEGVALFMFVAVVCALTRTSGGTSRRAAT